MLVLHRLRDTAHPNLQFVHGGSCDRSYCGDPVRFDPSLRDAIDRILRTE